MVTHFVNESDSFTNSYFPKIKPQKIYKYLFTFTVAKVMLVVMLVHETIIFFYL